MNLNDNIGKCIVPSVKGSGIGFEQAIPEPVRACCFYTRAISKHDKGASAKRPPLRLVELRSDEGDASTARVGLNRVDDGAAFRLNAATRIAASFCRAGIVSARPEVRTLLKKTWIKHCRP